MMNDSNHNHEFRKLHRVDPGTSFAIHSTGTSETPGIGDASRAKTELVELAQRISELQKVFYADSRHALLIVLQAMDTGGKDGTIRHVFGPVNPLGIRVTGFKVPSAEESSHDYLWRIHSQLPRKGMIRVFNRSHYEDVIVVRVHDLVPLQDIEKRYEHINHFEKYLTDTGITILKFFLHISKDEQKKRLLSRLEKPHKRWKFSEGDLAERAFWEQYQDAYEIAVNRCSTPWAPWYVIPSDRKWYRNYAVARIVLETLESMKLRYPEIMIDPKDFQIED